MNEVVENKPVQKKDKGRVVLVVTFLIISLLLLALGIIFYASFRDLARQYAEKSNSEEISNEAKLAGALAIGYAAVVLLVFSIGSAFFSSIFSGVGLGVSIARFRHQKTSQKSFYLTTLILNGALLTSAIILVILVFVL